MKLVDLHDEFIKNAERPMDFGRLPVSPRRAEAPVVAVDRWDDRDGRLVKAFRFRRPDDRATFVAELFAYEKEAGHHATMEIDEDSVTLRLFTRDTGKASELDREYARFADQLYRDVSYAPETGYTG